MRVVRCDTCELIQKTNADLVADYRDYEVFDNDPASDKIIRRAGQPDKTRAQFVADFLLSQSKDKTQARVLEIGCHRGAFLTALRAIAPQAELHGFDVNPDYADRIEAIAGKDHYHTGTLENVPGPFDAIVLIHTLEHVPAPTDLLRTVKSLLEKDGIVIVVVPDIEANPADAYTIDHASHFDQNTLQKTMQSAGFSASVDNVLISNELIAIGSLSGAEKNYSASPNLSMLSRFEKGLSKLPATSGYVFGTAMIGALLAEYLGDRCLGYADESPFRAGKFFHGKPVHHPRDLSGKTVYLGVAENLATQLTPKLTHMGLHIINPWLLGQS